jgi:hypothetical protein
VAHHPTKEAVNDAAILMGALRWANREFIDRFVCLSAALYPTKMLEYPGVGGAWRLLYARNEQEATFLLGFAQMRA